MSGLETRKFSPEQIKTLESEGFEFEITPTGLAQAKDGRKQRKLDRRVQEMFGMAVSVAQQTVQSVPTPMDSPAVQAEEAEQEQAVSHEQEVPHLKEGIPADVAPFNLQIQLEHDMQLVLE